jgi:hypothetical protein
MTPITPARILARIVMAAGFVAVAETALQACPICFQIEDAHVVTGVRVAVGVLMGVTVFVLVPAIGFAVKVAKRQQ